MTSESNIGKGIVIGLLKITAILAAAFVAVVLLSNILSTPTLGSYRFIPLLGSRNWVWIVAQVHLNFAAFVLGVPVFAVVMEYIGWRKANQRLDRMAYDFTKLFTLAYTITAVVGGVLMVSLPILYPGLVDHLLKILGPTWWVYLSVMYLEVVVCYSYYYSWYRMADRKRSHIAIGVLLNVIGTALMAVANAWVGYMTTPGGVTEKGELVSLWGAVNTYMWIPLNIHRFISNVSFGGAVAAAYAAYRFLSTRDESERAYYDWMGYISSMVAIGFSMLLPFMGYVLGIEIYRFNEAMGIQLMGGFFSWLWVMQAILIGGVLLFANFYLWISLNKMPGGKRYYRRYGKWLFIVLLLSAAVWLTPHSVAVSLGEARKIGGAYHPFLGSLGVMAAKNTAVALSMLVTFISYSLFRNAYKEPVVHWKRIGNAVKMVLAIVGIAIILGLGVVSYWVPAGVRVNRLSPIQFGTLFLLIIAIFLIDTFMYRGARIIEEPRWGKMPERSQYALIALTVAFTWLMGLMGYVRSGGRQYWHVYGVLEDIGPDAFLPAHGFATFMVSASTLLFLALVGFVFWSVLKAEKEVMGRRGLIGLILAVLVINGFFTYVGSYFLPQAESRPPTRFEISEGITQEELIKIGSRIVFSNRGQCMECHTSRVEAGMRAPAINTLGRLVEEAARERDISPEQHIFESLVNPKAWVTKGFDPIMKPLHKPPFSLTDGELIAVTAFVQSNGGSVTVGYPGSLETLREEIEKAGGR